MKYCLVVVALCCTTASAQVLDRNVTPKLEPYQMKALENALRGPKAPQPNSFPDSFTTLPPLNAPTLLPAVPSVTLDVATACAIPLRLLPADPKTDPGIRHNLPAEAFSIDRMAAPKVMPVCRQDH